MYTKYCQIDVLIPRDFNVELFKAKDHKKA